MAYLRFRPPSRRVLLLSLFNFVIAQNPTATIDSGTYTGLAVRNGQVDQYLGIKYAGAPRFQAPTRFSGTPPAPPQATSQSACPQFKITDPILPGNPSSKAPSDLLAPAVAENEDCLMVNVWTPKAPGDGTVLVYFPGGGFQTGWIGSASFNGAGLAADQGVVVVTANYRLGVLGFPNSTDIPLEGRNVGLLDQREALRWVQRNIGAFRGDPQKVTIWGESAGGVSVDEQLLTTPGSPPPTFQAAIAQSGSSYLVSIPLAFSSLAGAAPQTNWDRLAALLGCAGATKLQCMQSADLAKIKSLVAENNIGFNPVFDGGVTVSADAQVRSAKVPLLMGTNFAEGFSFDFSIARSFQGIVDGIQNDFVKSALNRLISLYNQTSNDRENSAGLITQLGFNCPARHETADSATAGIPTWRYLYNASFPNLSWDGPVASHGVEVPMIFGTYPSSATAQQRSLSAKMQKTWADFAKHPPDFNGWPQVGNNGRPDTYQMGVWREDELQVMGWRDADTPRGTDACNILDQVYGLFPGLITVAPPRQMRSLH